MKRLRLFILVFILALSVPLAYFVWRTYRSLEQEEFSQLRFFAETLFNEMEQEMAALVKREENRAIDEYNAVYAPTGPGNVSQSPVSSPLAAPAAEPYILGYFQNNPDGAFQTPLAPTPEEAPADLQPVIQNLEAVNETFNERRTSALAEPVAPAPVTAYAPPETAQSQSFAEKYLDFGASRRQKTHLGTEKKRIEPITRDQAVNLAQRDEDRYPSKVDNKEIKAEAAAPAPLSAMQETAPAAEGWARESGEVPEEERESAAGSTGRLEVMDMDAAQLEAEVDPMQSVFINSRFIFVFRRIAVNNRIYRQGFVLKTDAFLDHLIASYFIRQPMARFARLDLNILDHDQQVFSRRAGAPARKPAFRLERRFPRPFSFLQASLTCETIPRSQGRKTLNMMMAGLGGIMLAGLFAIYRSARAVMDLSERRTRFASSVTHELKTPLTNIRMYIEMLEQGIARTPEREQEYYNILNSESARLSRLINNVLEFSKLEQKKFHVERVVGSFEEVIDELRSVMQEKLRQEGFALKVIHENPPPFEYDREVMLQILINLMENSMKFGKNAPVREITLRVRQDGKWVMISVSDKGPGIPRQALKKVFNDFYRVDDSLTRTTRGTGIGLAFVKKAVTALGGKVRAEKNSPSGCVITIALPLKTD